MTEVRNWDDFTGLFGEERKKLVDARLARIRGLNDRVPVFGPLVDQALPKEDDESDGAYEQRRVDLLLLAAFTLFSNTRQEGQNVHVFLEYVQGIACTQMIAMGAELPPDAPDERLKEVSKLLDRELRFGEDYAIAMFSLNKVAWTTSVRGRLGIDMFELATRGARVQQKHNDSASNDDFTAALTDLLKNMGKKKATAPEAERAPTFMDGPNGPNDDGGTPT